MYSLDVISDRFNGSYEKKKYVVLAVVYYFYVGIYCDDYIKISSNTMRAGLGTFKKKLKINDRTHRIQHYSTMATHMYD